MFLTLTVLKSLKLQNCSKLAELGVRRGLKPVPQNLRGDHRVISSRSRRDVYVFIIKLVERLAVAVVLGVPVNPPCYVVRIHYVLEKVPTVPGVSQVGHHIYIKIVALIEVSKVRRDIGVWTRGDHNRPIRVIDISHIVGGD